LVKNAILILSQSKTDVNSVNVGQSLDFSYLVKGTNHGVGGHKVQVGRNRGEIQTFLGDWRHGDVAEHSTSIQETLSSILSTKNITLPWEFHTGDSSWNYQNVI
jgi:hypothetical protein